MLQQYRRISGLWKWATGVNDPNPPIDIDSVGGGNAAIADGPDTAIAAGTNAVAGSASVTEAAQTLTGAATHPVTGSSSVTEAPQTVTASGTVGALTSTGTATITEAPQTLTGSATHPVTGSSTKTEAAQTLTGAGTVSTPRTGTATITDAGDRVTASGTVADLIGVIDNGDWRPRSRNDIASLLEEIAEPARVVGVARTVEQADGLVASGTVSIAGTGDGVGVVDELDAAGRVTGLSHRDSDNQFWLLAA